MKSFNYLLRRKQSLPKNSAFKSVMAGRCMNLRVKKSSLTFACSMSNWEVKGLL